MKRDHRESTVGPWAKQKLDSLEAYLLAYMNVMKNQPFRLHFVDAFAGAGTSRVRLTAQPDERYPSILDEEDVVAEEEFIRGSPRRALELPRPFDRYYFFDLDPRRVELLQGFKDTYPNLAITAEVGDSNELVTSLVSSLTSWNDRGVAFLDPYGAHLRWGTLEALAATRKFDVIINFPLDMAINRLIKRDGAIPEGWRRQLNECFGCGEWEEQAFASIDDLFGGHQEKRSDAGNRLLALYMRRLRDLFGNIAGPSLVRNTKGAPLYYLIWAASNPTGRPIAKHILDLGAAVRVPR